MKLTDTKSGICVRIISLLLFNSSILAPLLFPESFGKSVYASSPTHLPSSENPQDGAEIVFDKKHTEKDNFQNSPFESIWKSFKDILDSTTKNVLSSSLPSSAIDSSNEEYNLMIRSETNFNDGTLNRRALLVEKSLNEHYSQQFLNSIPQLKEFTLVTEEEKFVLNSKASTKNNQNSQTEIGILRWKQTDTSMKESICYCFSESLTSHWSFQWCPKKGTIYQGRRLSDGVLQPKFILGTRHPTSYVTKEDDKGSVPNGENNAQYLISIAKAKHPSALAIYSYVDGDTCIEGGLQRRASVVIIHESTSAKCREIAGEGTIIENVVEFKVCQYMLHICVSSPNEIIFREVGIDRSVNVIDDGKDFSSPITKHGADIITESGLREINQTLYYIKNHVTESFLRKPYADAKEKSSRENVLMSLHSALPPLPQTRIEGNLKLIKDMFMHAYDSYMYNGYPASEVKPITCSPASFDLVKIPGLTLIDSLDTLVILGNYSEFARAVERLKFLNNNVFEATGIHTTGRGLFNIDYNVSVFETNIRVLGGLLSAHQLANAFLDGKVLEKEVWTEDKLVQIGVQHKHSRQNYLNQAEDNIFSILNSDCDITPTKLQYNQEPPLKKECQNQNDRYWVYDGFLLDLARDIGDKLLPAFNTQTGIPYGTVNLLSGIPEGETPIASLAGGGTLSLEMELLSRLTGNKEYGRAAKLAARALWMRRSPIGILGKHICTRKGHWTETLSGIGSNSDSFYEYLIKHYILFPEDSDFWFQLVAVYGGVHNESRVGEWYGDVDMKWGQSQNGAPRRVLEALMAFYPGMQVLLGEVAPAARTLNSFFLVREHLGFLPERFQFDSWKVDHGGGRHLLRPELLESAYFLHRATKGIQNQLRSRLNNITSDTSGWVWSGDFALHTIEKLTRTECGYGSLRNVSPETSGNLKPKRNQVTLLNEMPSYFLSETLKYLYLLFDDNNILHTDEEHEWVFTTEAHPIHNEQKEISIDTKLKEQTEELKLRIQRRIEKRKKPINDLRKTLFEEKWTESSKIGDFVQQLEPLMKNYSKMYLRHALQGDNSFATNFELVFPNDNSWSPFDVFNERLRMVNPSFLSFRKLGNEGNLTYSCPNLYASNFLWIRALNGGCTDYSDSYQSRWNDDFMVSESDIIQLGSVDALALHGTGVHIKSFYDAFYQCPIRDKKDKDIKIHKSSNNEERHRGRSNGSTRFEMGDGMGSFDVSAFPGGSGFFVRHVESGETVVTTLIEEETSNGSQGPLILVYSKREGSDNISFAQNSNVADSNPRTVVLADLRGNSYSCEVQIIESKILFKADSTCDTSQRSIFDTRRECIGMGTEDKVIIRLPCSPALFGPTHISHLEKLKSIEVEAKIQPPGVNDKDGCGRFNMHPIPEGGNKEPIASDSAFSSSKIVDKDEKGQELISIVQRGKCTFQEKSFNKKNTESAKGVIVINNNKGDDLFVMSGGGSEELVSLNLEEYPVTVLVTWGDGQKILETMDAHVNNFDTQISARISLVLDQLPVDTRSRKKSKFWPRVKASSDALQIYSQSGWGIHAVQVLIDNKHRDAKKADLQWQLYLLKHDMAQEPVS